LDVFGLGVTLSMISNDKIDHEKGNEDQEKDGNGRYIEKYILYDSAGQTYWI
jgi:hypothetical protein